MKYEDAVWLAGLLEGEAWFGERRGKGRSPRPMIALKMCDYDVVSRVAELFGGKAITSLKKPSDNYREQFVTRCVGDAAIEVMEAILPWMGKRRTETIEMLIWLYKDAPKGRQLSCNCGECPKCRNRSASQRYRERQKSSV